MLLEVSVKEKLTGTFQIGFGFAGGENFFGQAQLAQNNLLGYGHTASLSLQISSIRQLFQLSYLDPYVLDTQWTGSIDLYRSEIAELEELARSEEHTSELQSRRDLVCRLLLEKKKTQKDQY